MCQTVLSLAFSFFFFFCECNTLCEQIIYFFFFLQQTIVPKDTTENAADEGDREPLVVPFISAFYLHCLHLPFNKPL